MRKKPVYGIGATDVRAVDETGKQIKAHKIWLGVLERCQSPRYHRYRHTYATCSVHQQWHRFSAFLLWFDRNYRPGYHLDKDILIPGNKVYGPWTCCFVPQRINNLLLDCGAARGKLPRGITLHGNLYVAQCCVDGKKQRQPHATVEAAVDWYRATKSRTIRRTATDALVRREINLRVHAGLLRHAALIEFGG